MIDNQINELSTKREESTPNIGAATGGRFPPPLPNAILATFLNRLNPLRFF